MESLCHLFVSAALSIYLALKALLLPAAAFFLIGLLVKRRALFADLRRALPETVLNIEIALFNVVFVVPLITLLSQWLHDLVTRHDLMLVDQPVWAGLPPVLVIFIALFVGDFVGYWRHRLEHTALLWPSHAVHHSDEEMTWLTLERFHPVNRLTTFLIDAGALLVFGLPAYAIIANNLVRHYYGFLIHADLPWTFGRASLVFVSPAMHRWHHAADPRYFQTNFATVFSVFDRAFGTYRVPGPCTAPLGVTDDMTASLAGQMTYMLRPRAYRRLFTRRAFRQGAKSESQASDPPPATYPEHR